MPVINMFLTQTHRGLGWPLPLVMGGCTVPLGGFETLHVAPRTLLLFTGSTEVQRPYLAWEERILSSLFFLSFSL